MKSVVLVFGTRPETIKLAPVFLELARRKDTFRPSIWVTGQHREMLDQALETFALKPDRDFSIMTANQSLARITAVIIESLEREFGATRPDGIVVQGDTTTTFAASLAAFYSGVRVAHVEAGLRTGNKRAPFPEEINRRLTTALADYHFAPTQAAADRLKAEGIPEERVWMTGNTVIDALDLVLRRTRAGRPCLPPDFPASVVESDRRMVLITGHRRESFGRSFEMICDAIAKLARDHPECAFVYPVHLNENVREPVFRILGGRENVHLIEPLEYTAFVWAMDRSWFILSDSGGIQEEAPHLGKPVLVMRDTTERPEAIEAGTAKLVGTDFDRIVRESTRLLEDESAYAAMARARNPFGDGRAAIRIADVLAEL